MLLAQKYSDGWLPLQMLAIARPVTQWVSKRLKKSVLPPEEFLRLTAEHLRQEAIPSGGSSILTLEFDSYVVFLTGR